VTEPSFMEARGLKPAGAPKHAGPVNAKRLVEAYGCLVFPLQRGTKKPYDGSRGFRDAKADASSIVTNYGVWTGGSGIVAVDLDDYVADNLCDQFIEEYDLPPTFSVQTGSGGRSLWYRAPEGVDLTQRLGLWTGVDIKAGGSYVLGPGNKLANDAIKEGATGDGTYSFIKGSPTEFAPLPQKLVDALLATAPVPATDDVPHAAYDELDPEMKARADSYAADGVAKNLQLIAGLSELGEGERNQDGHGWETGCWAYAGALAQLIKADWNSLSYYDVLPRYLEAIPDSFSEWGKHARGMLPRTMSNEGFPARNWPFAIDEWFDRAMEKATLVDFRQAGGGEAEPSAEVVEVDEDPNDWPEEPWNEKGDAARTKRWANGGLRWLVDEEIWVRWAPEEHRWVKDPKAGARACQKALEAAEHTEILNYDDTPQLTKEGTAKPKSSQRDKFLHEIRNRWGIGQFERVAKSVALSGDLDDDSSAYDADGMLLAVKGGAVDLRTGEFVPGRPELKITVGSDVVFDPNAKAPMFERYLATSMPDPEMREYLQRIMGYSLIGGNPEAAFFIHWGPQTGNGKSVLMNVFKAIMGSQMSAASSKALIKSKGDKHSVEIADLAGPRVLQMGETAEGAALDEEVLKGITGGDQIAARKLNQSNKNWRIDGKIHILTNHKPHISASPSMKRRMHLVVWPIEIVKADQELTSKIIANEISGVLNWLLEGCLRWQRELKVERDGERNTGLIRPAEATMEIEEYLFEEDSLAEWFLDRVNSEAGEFETKSSQLYGDYQTWCWPKNVKPLSSTAFGRKLRERKILSKRKSDGVYYPLALKVSVGTGGYFSS
jgi:P4 family phage/plasmid primase-like protien